MIMNGYTMNWQKKTITITKAFAEEALDPNSSASQILQGARVVCPDIKIVARTSTSKRRNETKGLTYARMERYITVFEDCAEVYGEFLKVKQMSLSQCNPYLFVKDWFLDTFPNYGEMPEFIDGKLYINSPKLKVVKMSEAVNA